MKSYCNCKKSLPRGGQSKVPKAVLVSLTVIPFAQSIPLKTQPVLSEVWSQQGQAEAAEHRRHHACVGAHG